MGLWGHWGGCEVVVSGYGATGGGYGVVGGGTWSWWKEEYGIIEGQS